MVLLGERVIMRVMEGFGEDYILMCVMDDCQ